MLLYNFIIVIFVLIVVSPVSALQMTEIYPSPSGGEYEWVELFNNSESEVDTSTIRIIDATGKKLTFSTRTLLPQSYTIATSAAVLNSTNETVILQTISGNTIDVATYEAKIDTSESYTRCGDVWKISTITTKEQSNEPACVSPTPTEQVISPSPLPTTTIPEYSPTIIPPPQISLFINEVFASPQEGEQEWVELYNTSDKPVEIKDWYIDDIHDGGSSPILFSTTVPAQNYGVIELDRSLFNNDGDTVNLIDNQGNVISSLRYAKVTSGLSMGVDPTSKIVCPQQPTKKQPNTYCISPTSANTSALTTPSAPKLLATNKPPTSVLGSYSSIHDKNPEPFFKPFVSTGTVDPQSHTYHITEGKSDFHYARVVGQLTAATGAISAILAFFSIHSTIKKKSYEYDYL